MSDMGNPFGKIRRARHFTAQIYSKLLDLTDEFEDLDIDMDMQIIALTDINIQVLVRSLPRDKVKIRFKVDWNSGDDKYHIYAHEASFGGNRQISEYDVEPMLVPNDDTSQKISDDVKNYVENHKQKFSS